MSTTAGFERIRQADSSSSTPGFNAKEIVDGVRKVFNSRKTIPIEWRLSQLKAIERMMIEQCDNIMRALKTDLNRPDLEALLGDVTACSEEARFAMANLASWMKPEDVVHPIQLQPGKSVVVRQPKGVALIIGAWNFSFQLTILPLIAAISAGCCAIIKPSEIAPTCAELLGKIIHQYLDTSCIRVVQGAVPETTALLEQQFDHIFYTGNSAVAKVVMAAAAKHLTPVTLELGGKSPAIIDRSADLNVSVKRLLGGKFFNAGQICIAPDYVLCVGDERRENELINLIKTTVVSMFGEDPKASDSFGRLVNERHWDRVVGLIQNSKAEVVCGGADKADRATKFIPPTVLRSVDPSSPVMQEEIFGPVLPIVRVSSVDEAISFVNTKPRPLALYVFASNNKVVDHVVNNTIAGGTCVNDTLYHCTSPTLPFGGIGPSGLGAYHGRHGFEELSHKRAVMHRSTWLDPAFRYAPYQAKYVGIFKGLFLTPQMAPWKKSALKAMVVLSVAVTYAIFAKRLGLPTFAK